MLGRSWGCSISIVIFMEHLFYLRNFEEKLINGKIMITL